MERDIYIHIFFGEIVSIRERECGRTKERERARERERYIHIDIHF